MKAVLRFNRNYFIAAVVLFIIEVLIALFAHDKIIRPYIGDLLVVMLIYCFLRSFLNTGVLATAVAVLMFSYLIEILQYFNIADTPLLQHSKLVRIVLGTSFEWIDLVAYTAGIAIVLYAEKNLMPVPATGTGNKKADTHLF